MLKTMIIASMIHSTPWGVTGPLWTQFTIHSREAVQPCEQNAIEVERLWCSPSGCEEWFGQPCGYATCDGVAICFITQPTHFVCPLPDGVLYVEGVLPDYTTVSGVWSEVADWNVDGNVNHQDFADFLTAFLAGGADFNLDGSTDTVDLFEYLSYFFAG